MATNVLTANQSSADTALAWTAKAEAGVQNTTATRDTAVFFSTPASTKLVATAAGNSVATTGWRAIKNLVPGTYFYTTQRMATGVTPPSMKILTNCIDAAALLTGQPSVSLTGTHTADAWVVYKSANFVVPEGTIEGEAVITFTGNDAGEASYFDDLRLELADVAVAGPDQTVEADAVVTLTGTPAGGTWAQENGTAVTLSAATTTTTDTKVTFTATNDSTTVTSVREFRYTATDATFDIVSITTQPAPAPVSPGSGYYHNPGTGFVAMDLWIGEVPANTVADLTFQNNPVGAGVPAGWEGLFGLPDAEGAAYSVIAEGVSATNAARLTVGAGTVRKARLATLNDYTCTPGARVRVSVFAKTSDATTGHLRIGTVGNVDSGNSKQFKLDGNYQVFEFFWRVPAGNTAFNPTFTYSGLDGSTQVAPNSYMDIDSIIVESVPDGVPGLMRQVVGTKLNSTTGRISDIAPWNDGGYPIVGIRRTRNDPTGTLGGVFSAVDPADSTGRDFFNLAPGIYEFTTTAINEIGDGPTVSVTVDLSSTVAESRDITKHPYRGSWESGKALGTWSHWNTPIGSGADLQPSGLGATTAGGKTISGTIRRDPIHIGYENNPIRTFSATKKSDGTYYEGREPWKSGNTEQVHVHPDDTGPGNYSAGNSICAFTVANDPTRVWQGHPLLLTAGGNPSVRYVDPHQGPDDLYGTGMYGAHGGSHTTALSCIRQWEWDSPEENAIQHVIGYNTWASAFLRGIPQGHTADPKRWPSNSVDNYWDHDGNGGRPFREQHYGRYLSPPTGMLMGALLCLPSTYTWSNTLALNTRKVLWTMKNFGLLVVDDSAYEVHQLSVERTVFFASDFHAPIFAAIKNLKLVQNNAEATPGGGGTPRVPIVPDVIR